MVTLSNQKYGGWREGSLVKSTCCSCKASMFGSHQSRGGSRPSGTPVPGIIVPASGLQGHCIHVVHKHTQGQILFLEF